MSSNPELLKQVCLLLDEAAVAYRRAQHAPGETAEAIATARGTPLEMGVKALLFKIRSDWVLNSVRAHQRTDNRKVRHALKSQKLRFATREELASHGLAPGQVPPFGRPVLPFRLVADRGVLDLPELAFTAGSNSESVFMATEDWLELAAPEFFELS
jgi:prolyl-tRNA editing enzyme YbaK/EbsC (Cys-tRNA(Pro) deacylase)